MIEQLRKKYNQEFTIEQYQKYVQALESDLVPNALDYRIAETPVFVDKQFKNKLLDTCESIVDIIVDENFKHKTEQAIPKELRVPNENDKCEFFVFDFGVCKNEDGELEPQLIEMQGFPTLFAFQYFQDKNMRAHFNIPNNFSVFLNGNTNHSYVTKLKRIILADFNPVNVVLLEILPHQQKTRIDFYNTQSLVGIKSVCLSELIEENNNLFYINEGVKTPIHRIYNRIIFDDLQQQSAELKEKGKILFKNLNVEWLPHPNWFYRISKYTLPFIHHPFVPKTYFLNELKQLPNDLNNYVLKPLFSFAGQGVIIDVTIDDITKIIDPENWILQQKVQYADVIASPDGFAKAEIRVFYFWDKDANRPEAVCNLARLSKGKMIGVRYNQNKEWVGSSLAYFEQ
ncbi:MAG: hypothetical protein KGZ59_07535 [Chitinophagaceae bacterium]|nr:hypothetical protein [Chitinophagaceae bacterium]